MIAAAFGAPARAAKLSTSAVGFSAESVIDLARSLSRRPHEPQEARVPEALSRLTYDQVRDIRYKAAAGLWSNAGLPFQAQFFHLGSVYRVPVRVHEVADGLAREVLYEPADFDFGRNALPAQMPETLGFAGLRLHHPMNRADYFDELAVFLGASYFRSLGQGQGYGLSARGLAVDTALPKGEEFPYFRTFWIERPRAGATRLVLHALLDSPSLAGAYKFSIAPGPTVVMEIEARLFPRRKVERLGLAPLTSMFAHGPAMGGRADDIRPQVHDSEGLSLWTSAGEWLWRPLVNPRRLRLSVFADNDMRGFGLLQRDRAFANFQDAEAHFERRPSLWVEPGEGFGRGAVMLVEIPAESEINDNIVAFWAPAQAPEAGQEVALRYRLHWGREAPHRPASSEVIATRTGRGGVGTQRRFAVDFRGPALDKAPPDGFLPVITASAGRVVSPVVQKLPPDGVWRLQFEVRPEGGTNVELRALLKAGAQTASETWSYQWSAS
jgi:glucans biosynthesis protein